MAHVLHRTTKQWIKSVNTPDFPSGTWSIHPSGWEALEAGSVPTMYWKITGVHPAESVSEMAAGEKTTVDNEPARLAASKEARNSDVEAKTLSIIATGFVYATKTFGLSDQQQADLKSWKAKTRGGTDTYPVDWILLDPTSYAIASRAIFNALYQVYLAAIDAAYEGELTLKEQIYEAATKAILDAVTDGRSVTAYSGGGAPNMYAALTGSQDLTAGTPVDLNITGANSISRIARARFWISQNGVDVGTNVTTRIVLKFFNKDGFTHSEEDTNGVGGLLEAFNEFQFASQDVKVAASQTDGTIDVDDKTVFGIDDLVRIHDGTNWEYQRVEDKTGADTLDLYDTILASAGWAVDDDVSRVLEIRDLSYMDQDDTDEIHLQIVSRSGDDNCRLHYWIEYEGGL